MMGLYSRSRQERREQSSMRSQMGALLGDRRRAVVALTISSTFSGLTEAGFLAMVSQIAATIVNRSTPAHGKLGVLHLHLGVGTLFAVALGLILARLLLQAPLAILPARIASSVQARLRRDLFSAYTRASWAVQSSDREGHLQETLTSQVIQASTGAQAATSLIVSAVTFFVLMASALVLNVLAALVVFVSAVVLFALLRPLNQLGVRRARALSRAQMQYAGGVSEANRVAEETHVFGVGAAQRERVDGYIGTAQKLLFQVQVVGRAVPSLYQGSIYLILLAALGGLYEAGAGHAVALGAVVLIVMRAGTYGQAAQGSYQILRQSLPFIERLRNAEQRYAESQPRDGEEPLTSVQTIAFEKVSFAYRPGQPVLSDISFEMDRGETVGIVGPSGAGKSTLIQILLKLRVPDEGRYLINGTPAEEFVRADWYKRVAYVPQEPRLVHASVAENVRFFRDIDDEAVERACRLARIHDAILTWSKGYDTIVGPRADALSGGQQQRLCIARALAGRPEVLVLDEPTSALDSQSESLIQESLTSLKSELTLVIIAHRMSTLDVCDRVMVVLEGRLVAFDTTELLRRNNSYYQNASMLAAGAHGGRLP
jgi:ABC-type multidrug transport system fused ATPase/permease subunit